MAGSGCGWKKALAVAVLLGSACGAVFAQSEPGAPTGSLSGRLTDLHSRPLEGVTLTARNQKSGAEASTTTQKNGAYRFTGLEPGEYTLEADGAEVGHGQLEEIEVDAGHESQVRMAMEFAPLPPNPLLAKLRTMSRREIALADWPLSEAALDGEPLQTLKIVGERLAEVFGYAPQTEALSCNFALAYEPMQTLALTGVRVPFSVAETAAIRTEAAQAAAGRLSQSELQALPVSGRHWQDFVLDTAPASVTSAGGQGQISQRGAGQPAEIAVDGVSKKLAFGSTKSSGSGSTGQGTLGESGEGAPRMAQVGVGGHGLAVSEAAIRAVETAANAVEAEANRAADRGVNELTQSGTNELHGQGFAFDRQGAWGARNPFTQWTRETSQATGSYVPIFTPEPYTPPDRESVWGVGAGSRIRRDKLFWFGALDGYSRNNPGVATLKHQDMFFAQPSSDEMLALCSRLVLTLPGELLPCTNALDQGVQAYSGMLKTLAGLLGPAPRTAQQWTGFGRLDWRAAERHHFTMEGVGSRWNSPGGGLTRTSEAYGNQSFGSTKASEEWLLGRWEAFLTPNLLAVTQASAGRTILTAKPERPTDPLEKSFLSANSWGQLPQIVVDSRYGFTIGNPSRFGQGSYPDEHIYQVRESLDWARGKLLIKAGIEASHNADATSLLRNQTGTYTYSSVENFVSDALAFQSFGIASENNPRNLHNCDQTGKAWRDSNHNLEGMGNLPCYSYYSQTIGPASWRMSTKDWAGFASAQWQAGKLLVFSAGVRWERELLPPPIAALSNSALPLTQRLPSLGNDLAPRLSMTVGSGEKHWPLLRLGYGIYFGRTGNMAVMAALTQTGSLALTPAKTPAADLNFFLRPTDNLKGGGAPPFPYVLTGLPGSVVKPGAVEFAPSFHNPEIHQAIATVEESLPSRIELAASAMLSLGRRLPISIDTNFDPAFNPGTITYAVCDENSTASACGSAGTGPIKVPLGPIKAAQITVPFYASWPSQSSQTGVAGRLNPEYQQITQMESRANSTYEAFMLKLVRYGRRGLTVRAHYTYSHAMDWNPNESARSAGNDVLDAGNDALHPSNFRQEYGTSDLDVRHTAGVMAIYEAQWKLRGTAGKLGNGWMLSGVAQFRSGLPYTMRTSGSLTKCIVGIGITPCTAPNLSLSATTGEIFEGLGPGMNGSGGDNRVYGLGGDGISYNIGRNSFRYPATWKADLRLGKRFDLGHMRQLELLAESFNLFNHQNVTELETTGYYIKSGSATTPPTLNYLTGLKANTTAFGQPLNVNATNFYHERQIQFGLRLRF